MSRSMDTGGIAYTFSATVWYSEWCFVSLPKAMADEIREHFKSFEEGWGRLKITAQIGDSAWETAIWYDTKQQTYLLPVKKAIRIKEKINVDAVVSVTLWI